MVRYLLLCYLDGFEIMRLNAFVLTLTTFVAGIFGFFLRWLQNLNGFEADSGLAIPGAATAIVFTAYSVVVLALFIFEACFYFRKLKPSILGAEALHAPDLVPTIVMWVLAAIMVISCVVLMFGSDFARYPTMQRMMSAVGIFAGISLPFILHRKADSEDAGLSAIAAVIPVLFYSLWLITAYRVESENPVLWAYAPEMLAIIAATLAFYYIAAYFYGRAKPDRCLVMVQLAAYLCLCTLMDDHAATEKLLFGVTAGAMLMFQYVILQNAKVKE